MNVAPTLGWRKSSYSNNSGSCVELAQHGSGLLVRDSKNPAGPVLGFSAARGAAFVAWAAEAGAAALGC